MTTVEFEEIAHSGGELTFTFTETERGMAYSIRVSGNKPNAMAMVAMYALPQGIPVEIMSTMGLGVPFTEPKVPGSYLLFLSSDREGWFGRSCQWCNGYWRAQTPPSETNGYCPYCGLQPQGTLHLTEGQSHYVANICQLLSEARLNGPAEYKIDLNEIADAAGMEGDKPPFFYAEERQQSRISCSACGYEQDVLGRSSYCCVCCSRNDFDVLRTELDGAQQRARNNALEGALRDAVSAFDGFIDTVTGQIIKRVPVTKSRAAYWSGNRPRHNLKDMLEKLDEHYGFKAIKALKGGEMDQANRMVERRHVHEHRNGIVDQRYIDETGDTSVRLGQALREQQSDIFQLIGSFSKIAKAVSEGFAELFPPNQEVIEKSNMRPGANSVINS